MGNNLRVLNTCDLKYRINNINAEATLNGVNKFGYVLENA